MTDHVMDAAFRPAGLDRATQGVLGRGIDRVEGPANVTGVADYAYEGTPERVAYAAIVGTPVGSGRILSIDARAAEAMPGVIAVLHGDPRMPAGESNSSALPLFDTDTILHLGQPVAVVVAEDQAIARDAAALVRVETEAGEDRFDVEAQPVDTDPAIGFVAPVDMGDLDAAMRDAAVTLDATYTTPVHFPAARTHEEKRKQ